jgi:hypothetical protein
MGTQAVGMFLYNSSRKESMNLFNAQQYNAYRTKDGTLTFYHRAVATLEFLP